jgi:hypothetical protein
LPTIGPEDAGIEPWTVAPLVGQLHLIFIKQSKKNSGGPTAATGPAAASSPTAAVGPTPAAGPTAAAGPITAAGPTTAAKSPKVGGGSIQKSPGQDYSSSKAAKKAKQAKKPGKHCALYTMGKRT